MSFNPKKYEELIAKARQRLDEVRKLQEEGLICYNGEFVPSVHYPPITQYPPATQEELFAGYTVPKDGMLDIYVHFPFCEQRCTFCHYPGKLGPQMEEKNRYIAALEKEMDIYMELLGVDRIKPRSVLVGGGTPTYLTPEQLNRFLDFFNKRTDLSGCRQFNYDVDPVTLIGNDGHERLRIMRDHGVDRLTIGVQSLDDNVLKLMNRHHDSKAVLESIENCRKYGFQLNIEFIYGHPGETFENWIEVMEKAVALDVDEIQIYRLKVLAYGDLQGNIKAFREKNPCNVPTFEDTMMMKQLAIDILNENGFHENLRRVYSKEKKHYSHYAYNQCCMLYDQLGFGITAFSSLRDRFALNTQTFEEYYASIEKGRLPVNRGYIRDKEQQARWAIVLPLKNSDIKKNYYEKVTGIPFDKVFPKKMERLKQYGLIEEKGNLVKLTELGSFVADEVVEQFNSNEFMPFPSEAYAKGPLNPYSDNSSYDALGNAGNSEHQAAAADLRKKEALDKWDVVNMTNEKLLSLLTSSGSLQQKLFEQARTVRTRCVGENIKLRGVIEISNHCQKNCDYCAMRCGNNSVERYRMNSETIMEIAKDIMDAGIDTVFLQSGQDPKCDSMLEEVIPQIVGMGAEVLLCVGERDKETYQRFAGLGAKSFILKFETSDVSIYEKIAHADLNKRIDCMNWIRESGMQIGTGNIVGLPYQLMDNLIADIRFAFEYKPDFISSAPFIPNSGTPFQDCAFGDINLTLNTMAILRIGLKYPLIPAVSALESICKGGQLMGLNAGANVMTINFTPKLYRENYKIYSKDRYIVGLEHAVKTAEQAGLRVARVI